MPTPKRQQHGIKSETRDPGGGSETPECTAEAYFFSEAIVTLKQRSLADTLATATREQSGNHGGSFTHSVVGRSYSFSLTAREAAFGGTVHGAGAWCPPWA
jgi:hypothetical protein